MAKVKKERMANLASGMLYSPPARDTRSDANQINNGVIGAPTGDRMTAGGRKGSLNFPELVQGNSVRSVNASQNRPGWPDRPAGYQPDWDVNQNTDGDC